MDERKIKHSRLYEQVIALMEEQFKNGHLKLGDTLASERELAQQFGVSRGTLRDAFRILESQGIIETRPGGGRYLRKELGGKSSSSQAIINNLQKAAMLDLLEAREIFEVGMAELICQRATDEDIQGLEEIVNNQTLKDPIDSSNMDYYFHHALAKCSKNSALVNYLKLNLELIIQTRQKNLHDENQFAAASKEHMEIVKSLKTRNVDLVKQAFKEHFKNIRKRLHYHN